MSRIGDINEVMEFLFADLFRRIRWKKEVSRMGSEEMAKLAEEIVALSGELEEKREHVKGLYSSFERSLNKLDVPPPLFFSRRRHSILMGLPMLWGMTISLI